MVNGITCLCMVAVAYILGFIGGMSRTIKKKERENELLKQQMAEMSAVEQGKEYHKPKKRRESRFFW